MQTASIFVTHSLWSCVTSQRNSTFISMKFFNLAFISAFPGHNLQNRNFYGSNPLRATSLTNVVNLNVGGVKYSLFDEDIRKHPGSFFEKALEDRQVPANMDVNILRDGNVFKFVNAFMVNGHLPENLNAETISNVKAEADFYTLPALMNECDAAMGNEKSMEGGSAPNISLFTCTALRATTLPLRENEPQFPIEFAHKDSPVFGALRRVLAPPYRTGAMCEPWDCKDLYDRQLFKSSTVNRPNATELLEVAQDLAREYANKDSNTYKLPPAVLSRDVVERFKDATDLRKFYERRSAPDVVWKESGLLVQTPETGSYEHTPPSLDNYVGTVHAVLNSTFEGGEINICMGDQQTSVNVSSFEWAVVHADGSHCVAPVTAGARVSLIYDLYAPPGQSRWDNTPLYFHHSDDATRPEVYHRKYASVSEEVKEYLFSAVDAELRYLDSLDVGLQHLYPKCHNTPISALKGSDRTLYDILSERYDVQVVAATYRSDFYYHDCGQRDDAGLYFPPDINQDPSIHAEGKSKLFLPLKLPSNQILDEIEDSGHVYLLSALRVRKK